MSELLSEGGKTIYVAPSGGRDRRNNQGIVEVAPFDPQSIEMLLLDGSKSRKNQLFSILWPYLLMLFFLLLNHPKRTR